MLRPVLELQAALAGGIGQRLDAAMETIGAPVEHHFLDAGGFRPLSHELADLAGIDIPVKVTGTFAKPEYGLDEEALVKALATGKAKELVGKGTEGVKQAVEGKLKDAVGGNAIGELTKQLGGAGGAAPAAGDGEKAADPAATAGKALKSLFGN